MRYLIIISFVFLSFSIYCQEQDSYRLKLGPVYFDNEVQFDFVYGVKDEYEVTQDFITEFHFNISGPLDCIDREMSASFDFTGSKHLILSDSLNPVTTEFIKRQQTGSTIHWIRNELSPDILIFTIEKINLKAGPSAHEIRFRLSSDCDTYIDIPIVLSKFTASDINHLIDNYIEFKLNKRNQESLLKTKTVFSFNRAIRKDDYMVDLVDQRPMQILTYNPDSNEYIISDVENRILRRVKRDNH